MTEVDGSGGPAGAAVQPNRSTRHRPGRLALVGGIAMALGLAGIAAAWVEVPIAAGSHAEIRIHFSHFGPTEVVAKAGVPITITLVNTDPIDHEWLVGDASFHARHRTGTEPVHGDRPDEVSVAANTTKSTTLTFAAGSYLFICHFPLHEQYGMIGIVTAK